jgi:hypothetical protein
VEWIYRREELGETKKGERIYGHELLLTDVKEEEILARRLRGKFRLEHIDRVNPNRVDAQRVLAKFDSNPFSFWTEYRVKFKNSKFGVLGENPPSRKTHELEPISMEDLSQLECPDCRASHTKQDEDEARVLEQQDKLKLPNLALYAGAGFLDCGLKMASLLFTFPRSAARCADNLVILACRAVRS